MAYLSGYEVTYLNGAVTATAMNFPPHATNDILIAFVTMDTGSATITTGTGWSTPASNTTQGGITATWMWKRATSDAEVLSITTADAYCCGIYCISDVDTTTAIDVSTLNSAAAPTLPARPISDSVTTTTADCFILYLAGSDGIALAAHADPGVHHIISFDNQGTTATTASSQHAAWYIQRNAGAVPTPSWNQSAAGAYVKLTIALRNKSGGTIPAYIDDVTTPATVITPAHNYVSTNNNISWTTTLTSTAAINGKTVSGIAGAAQADLGINNFSSGLSKAAAIAAKTTLSGFQATLTGNRNWSTGLIVGSYIGGTPKEGTFGVGSVKEGGCVIRIGSSSTAWCAYQVAAKNGVPNLEGRAIFAIQPGYTGSAYGTPGTAVTTTAVTHIQFLSNQPSFSSRAILSEVYQAFTQVVAGGDSVNPVDTDGMADVGKSFRLPVIQKFGGSGLLSYLPIQIGGGDAVNFQIDAGALQFPRRYSTVTREIGFHAADYAVGISYAGKSGDVIKHTNSVITSPTPYYWNINASATSAATWDFTGLVIVNAQVVLRNVMTFDSMAFSQPQSIDASGCALTNCTVSKPANISNVVTTSASTTYNNVTFDTTTLAASTPLMTVADTSSIFTKCTFNGSATSGHAMTITAAGGTSITLNGCVFNNYGADTTNSAALNFTASSGTITVNITNGGTTPTYKSAGATIVISNSKALTLTGIVPGSDIVITSSDTTTVLVDINENATSSYIYTYAYAAGVYIDIKVLKAGYVPYPVYDYLLGAQDSSLPISQVSDRNYLP